MINCVQNTLSTPVSDLPCLTAYWELKKKKKKERSSLKNKLMCYF